MANAERGELGVTVEGRPYTLRPTFDSLCELEALVDQSLDEVLATVNKGRLSGIRAIVWCLLQEAHAAEIRSLKDASQWIEQAGGVPAVLAMVQRVMGLNAEEPVAGEAPDGGPPVAQDDGIGVGSSSTPVASV